MFIWLTSKIRRIAGVIIVKAQYWTALGAMAMPLGVSILALDIAFRENSLFLFWMWVAVAFIIVGLLSFIAGWSYTIKEEHKKDEKEQEEKKQRQEDEKRRQREHRENLIMLIELSKKHGMSTPRLIRLLERLEEVGQREDEL